MLANGLSDDPMKATIVAALLVDRGGPNFTVADGMPTFAALVVALTATVLQPAAAWFLKQRVSPRSRLWAP